MFCSECGAQIPDDVKFCASCGTKIASRPGGQAPSGTDTAPAEQPPATSTPASTADTTAIKSKPTWKKIVTWAFLFIVGVFALASIITSGLMVPVDAHLTALRSGDIETAYTHTSRDFRASTPLPAFQKFVQAYPALTKHTNFSMVERSFEGGEGRVIGHLLMQDKKIARIEFIMIEDGDNWKIQGLELKAPESND
jgi:hypothetical protein